MSDIQASVNWAAHHDVVTGSTVRVVQTGKDLAVYVEDQMVCKLLDARRIDYEIKTRG